MESTQVPTATTREERCRDFGSRFRLAREAKGCSVRALAQLTRISAGFIEALENGDFDKLPGEVFGRGFVRSICKSLHLDTDDLIAAFDRCWEPEHQQKSILQVEYKTSPYRQGKFAALCLFLNERLVQTQTRRSLILGFSLLCLAGLSVWQVRRLPISLWKNAVVERIAGGATKVRSSSGQASKLEALPEPAQSASSGSQAVPDPAHHLPSTNHNVTDASSQSAPATRTTQASASVTASVSPKVEKVEVVREGQGEQVLEIQVSEKVRLRTDVDAKGAQAKEYTPGLYQFKFINKIDMMVYDAAAVNMTFNGRPVGSLGNKGRVRRISFHSNAESTRL